jgi:hypothetical protein
MHQKASFALWVAWYNFVRVNTAVRMTPCMAAGITGTIWTMRDLHKGEFQWVRGRPQIIGEWNAIVKLDGLHFALRTPSVENISPITFPSNLLSRDISTLERSTRTR